MKTNRLAEQLLGSTILTCAAVAFAAPAFAQETESDDEIVVAGSRIQREDLEAVSPVTTVSSEQLLLTNTVNTEQFLNTLPQVIPSFDATSNNPGTGTATVDLRGLGTNRTLVLVNGQRFVSEDVNSRVDLNNIPAALVERIEVVTGGASAIYGSDAVSGVVNFVLKDDFEGVQLDISNETSLEEWDGDIFNASITMGGNFDNGRGNAVVFASYTNRQAVFQGDRDFSEFSVFDLGAGADEFGIGGSSTVPGTRFRGRNTNNFGLSAAQVNALDPACATNACLGFFVNDAGDVRGLRFGGGAADPATDLYNFAPVNYLQLPQERYNITALGSYDINENMEAYFRGVYSNNVVDSQLAPTPGGFTVAVNNDNPFIPADLLALFLGDANSNGFVDPNTPNSGPGFTTFRFNKRFEEVGPRNSLRDSSAFQIVAGVRGDFGNSWNYDLFYNFSRASVSTIQSGNVSIAAIREAILTTDGVTCSSGNANCAPLDIFNGPGSVSAEAAAFISRTGAQINNTEQNQIVGTLGGDFTWFKSPWATAVPAVVGGFEYRSNEAEAIPDSVLGPDVLGFNQSLPVGGSLDVYEIFGEAKIPLIQDQPFIHDLTLDGAYRRSSYSLDAVGDVNTYAYGISWAPVEQFRLRGQIQRAVRAPNVGELFSAFTNGFPGASDPCSGGTFGSFSAATDVSTCILTGVPSALVGTAFQSNGQIEVLGGGNPNLEAEVADTITYGFVWEPSFLNGFDAQLDYYKIEVEGAIGTVGLQRVLDGCHVESNQTFCNLLRQTDGTFARNPATGEIASPFLPALGNVNLANLEVEGIDLIANWRFAADAIGLPASLGSFTAQYYGTYTLANDFQEDPTAAVLECAGFYGANCGEPTPEYKHNAQFTLDSGKLTNSLRWRYIGGTDSDTAGLSDLSDDIEGFNYFDYTAQLEVSENLDVTLGIQNLFDEEPPILGSTVNEQANTFPATYETLGRQLFLGASLRF